MNTSGKKVSFPVVVSYLPATSEIQMERPTNAGFRVRVGQNAEGESGHPQLYRALELALIDSGPEFGEPPALYN